MTALEAVRLGLAGLFLLAGVGFLVAAAVAVRRLPDSLSRLHAVTKAETAGLGLFLVGVALTAPGWKLALAGFAAWVALAVSGASAAHFIAETVLRDEPAGRDAPARRGGAAGAPSPRAGSDAP
ncbi:MAG: cation:proton antiporter [Rhodobacteraceae bacterium]|nr:MAG: cation:proton antiporter [Paracoccaceae bacterium]